MLYTCECCDSIFEHEETDKAIRCPYCGRIKHDVWGPGYIATQLAVREASAEEFARYHDPKGYNPPNHDDDWISYLLDPHMQAYADIPFKEVPDEKLIRQFMKTHVAPTKGIADYANKMQKAYYELQYEMAVYDTMYFDPEEVAM